MYIQNMKRGAVVFLLLLAIAAVNSSMLNAFGISTPYMKDETLLVNPGKIYEYVITLQNNDAQPYYVDVTYSSSEDIASLKAAEYYVPAYTYNVSFSFILNIPATAEIGDTYALEYAAKPRVDGSGAVSMGVEIRRGITVLVTDGTTVPIITKKDTEISAETKNGIKWAEMGKYVLLILVLMVAAFMVLIIWRVSKKISSKISKVERTGYTISEAMNLDEVKRLLQNINDDAFEVSEIKNLFKDKLSELTTNDISHRMIKMTRRELIKEIDKIKK